MVVIRMWYKDVCEALSRFFCRGLEAKPLREREQKDIKAVRPVDKVPRSNGWGEEWLEDPVWP